MTDQPTSNITLRESRSEFGKEIIRIDDKGFHYQGQFNADAGEAHRLMVEFLKQQAQPEPQGPMDEELVELFNENDWNYISPETFIDIARAVLECWGNYTTKPDGPAVPHGREPASVADQPTDKELLDLMPETMRDEFSYAAKVCSDATGGQVKPGIFRVALNTAALEYARAVLARWGRPAIEPAVELTVQDCADMEKHRMSFIDEDSSGLITLDGCFTREELLELAQTRPATEQESRPLPDAMQRRCPVTTWKQPKSAKDGDLWLDSSGVVRVRRDGEWVVAQKPEVTP